ncbi:hypothetical protein BpHYR1_016568 [Brachionus plicatilis]|uniref:Uncharacterized protein n=1 Tax=Brachionus plicatilis TaxID=10195 RepID=A0A3M7QM04_BRAPC|nr:hypothetical protein BpHYR1_016568 [Brachionus plicatilis]
MEAVEKQKVECKLMRTCGCPAKLYILFHADSTEVSIYKIGVQHNEHSRSKGMPEDVKKAIDQLTLDYKRAKQIEDKLEERFPGRKLPTGSAGDCPHLQNTPSTFMQTSPTN